MRDHLQLRMPTGIASLDPLLDGGIPPGSVVLLLGEHGAGNVEFVQSSIMHLAILKRNKKADESLLPGGIVYVTLTRMQEDILREMALSFNPDLYTQLAEEITFYDLSELYFDASIVPPDWYREGGSTIKRLQRRQHRESGDILAELVRVLGGCSDNSLIVMDSLTEIAPSLTGSPRWHAFVAFLRGLQQVAKHRNITIYLPLTSGILDRSQELEIADCVDATLLFRWEETGAQRRQRVMHFERFRGVMPRLEEKDLVKFAVKISAGEGFEVQNIRMVV
jgi:KaiC/GvpD/RAD55 family RecA-like ATPase